MSDNLVKIVVNGPSNGLSQGTPETLWALPVLRRSTMLYEIRNSPFYIKGLSYLDLVLAKPTESDCLFRFTGVYSRSGHSTYRVIVERDGEKFAALWKKLETLGCTYESSNVNSFKLLSIDVPVTTDIYAVYSLLSKGEEDGVWQFEEGFCGHTANPKWASH